MSEMTKQEHELTIQLTGEIKRMVMDRAESLPEPARSRAVLAALFECSFRLVFMLYGQKRGVDFICAMTSHYLGHGFAAQDEEAMRKAAMAAGIKV